MLPKLVLINLIFINLLTFILFGIDKFKAVHHKWRIPEIYLLISSFLGGIIGTWLAMFCFNHKLKDKSFKPWIILISIFWMIIICVFLKKYMI